MILVGNKIDKDEREVSLLEGREIAQKLGCEIVEASAKDGEYVQEIFNKMGMQLRTLSMKQALLYDLIESRTPDDRHESDGSSYN